LARNLVEIKATLFPFHRTGNGQTREQKYWTQYWTQLNPRI